MMLFHQGDEIDSAVRKLLERLDETSAILQRASWGDPRTVAVLDVDDWSLIRGAELELRELLGMEETG